MVKPVTVGITGGSGSGKTFFLQGLAARFKPGEVGILSQDNYYKPLHEQQRDERGVENFDVPESIDHEAFHADLLSLKSGKSIQKKEYTFNNPGAEAQLLECKPAPVLIVEGLFVQYLPEIEKELDLKIFIEAEDHVKLGRRILRDRKERGYDL